MGNPSSRQPTSKLLNSTVSSWILEIIKNRVREINEFSNRERPKMDLAAYDLLQENAVTSDTDKAENQQGQSTLNNDIQDAYKAFSSSPWGAKIGGFFGSVVKQVS